MDRKIISKTLFLACWAVLLSILPAQAKVQVPSLFSDQMVLQQKAIAPIWGRAEPGEAIQIQATWERMELSTYADSKGHWRMDLQTPEAGGPYQILIKASNTIILEDVMIGEVWLASGQSNMHWPIKRSERADAAMESADNLNIRFFQVERDVSTTPRFDNKGQWRTGDEGRVADFSAVAYHFARELHDSLGITIGIIQSTWGGSPAEAWTSREMLGELDSFVPYLDEFDDAMRDFRSDPERGDPVNHKSPTVLFNAMVHPLIPYAMQGVIWYQGESNVSDPYLYRELFPAMIRDWQHRWGWRFSFYYVQIAPYLYAVPQSGAGLREAQLLTLRQSNTGMAVTMDVGNPYDIHPRDKQTVGRRLARLALHNNYQRTSIVPSGPLLHHIENNGTRIRLRFHYAEGLRDGGHALEAFEIAGSDQRFFPAIAEIQGSSILLTSPKVENPIAVRFAFADSSQAALINAAGLPASSFRTDDWGIFFTQPQISARYLPTKDQFEVSMTYRQILAHQIHYTTDGTEPTHDSPIYETPFLIQGPATLRAQVFIEGQTSPYEARREIRRHIGLGKKLIDPIETRYAGNPLDGMHGSSNPNDGEWMGLSGDPLVLLIDLEEKQLISRIETRFLQDQAKGIFLPKEIRYEVSSNGNRYKEVHLKSIGVPVEIDDARIVQYEENIKPSRARYIRLTISNPGTLPDWHPNSGGQSTVLIDEVVIE